MTRRLLIRAGSVVDATDAGAKKDHAILIEDDLVAAVGPIASIKADGAEVIDLTDCTLVPGLMDLHVHLMSQNAMTYSNYRYATFEVTPQAQMLHALVHAQLTMEMGFTTLRDLGWMGYAGNVVREMVALRDAIASRFLPGPRLVVGAMTTTTGSHLELVLPPNAPRLPNVTQDGPWALRKLARENIRAGADWIKTNASGGISGAESISGSNLMLTQEEMDAVVSEAHTFGKKAAIHSYTPAAQKMALKAGVDTLEHAIWTDDEAMALMKKQGVALVPTLVKRVDETTEIGIKAGRLPLFSERIRAVRDDSQATFRRLHQAGVKIALGTDTTVEPLAGKNAQEMVMYAELGMTQLEALQTATKNAAEVLGLGKTLGTLEAGKQADLVAVRGDPLKDVSVVTQRDNIRLVVKGGRVYVDKREGHERSVIQESDYDWVRS